jgi:hypothetical protein
MKPHTLLLLLPVAAIMLVSGCTIPGTDVEIPFISGLFGPSVSQDVTDVVVITSLRSIPDTVVPGQTFRIVAYVQNKGSNTLSADGKNPVEVELYDYCSGLFDLLGNSLGGGKGATEATIPKLLPYETKEIYWTLQARADTKLKTTCPKDGMKVSVTYPYTSTSLSTITFINPTEYARRIEQNVLTKKTSELVAGDGPVRAYLSVEDDQPIPVNAGTTVLALNIENKGSGYPKTQEMTANDPGSGWQVKLDSFSIAGLTWSEQGCEIQGSGGLKTKLIQNKRKIVCSATIPGFGDIGLEATKKMEAVISYEYQFTASVPVTVEPKT